MKSYRKELWFSTPHRREFINITPQVEECLRESGIREGLCSGQRHAHHRLRVHQRRRIRPARTTSRSGWRDWRPRSRTRSTPTTAPKTTPMPTSSGTIMGREVVVAVTDGRLDFGPWEQIFYGEFDGRRRKRVLVKIIGE